MLSVSPNKGLGSLLEEASFKLLDPSYHYYAVRSLYLQSKFSVGLSTGLRQDLLDFDQALVFLVRAKCLALSLSNPVAIWDAAGWGRVLCLPRSFCPRWLWMFVLFAFGRLPGAMAMPMFPRAFGERTKAAFRHGRPAVPPGGPVLSATQQRSSQLLDDFTIWFTEEGLDNLTMRSDINVRCRLLYHFGKVWMIHVCQC